MLVMTIAGEWGSCIKTGSRWDCTSYLDSLTAPPLSESLLCMSRLVPPVFCPFVVWKASYLLVQCSLPTRLLVLVADSLVSVRERTSGCVSCMCSASSVARLCAPLTFSVCICIGYGLVGPGSVLLGCRGGAGACPGLPVLSGYGAYSGAVVLGWVV